MGRKIMSMHFETTPEGYPVLIPNEVIESDGFYISYNNWDVATYGSDTTALVWGQMQRFYVLNGDHRSEYQKLIDDGFDACLEYFNANIGQANKYSEHHERFDKLWQK